MPLLYKREMETLQEMPVAYPKSDKEMGGGGRGLLAEPSQGRQGIGESTGKPRFS